MAQIQDRMAIEHQLPEDLLIGTLIHTEENYTEATAGISIILQIQICNGEEN